LHPVFEVYFITLSVTHTTSCMMSVHYIVSYDGMVTDNKFEGNASA